MTGPVSIDPSPFHCVFLGTIPRFCMTLRSLYQLSFWQTAYYKSVVSILVLPVCSSWWRSFQTLFGHKRKRRHCSPRRHFLLHPYQDRRRPLLGMHSYRHLCRRINKSDQMWSLCIFLYPFPYSCLAS